MAETATADPPQTERVDNEVSAEIQQRREGEVRAVASALFNRRKERFNPDNADADPAARQLITADYYANLGAEDFIDEEGKEKTHSFPESRTEGKGNPLEVVIDGKSAVLVEIAGIQEDDKYDCFIMDPSDQDVRQNVTLSRKEVFTAHLLSERDIILNGFQGDQKIVAETYLTAIDPRTTHKPEVAQDTTKSVESVAKEHGMITTTDIKTLVRTAKGDQIAEADADKLFAQLEGKTILEKDDFTTLIRTLGLNPDSLREAKQQDTKDILHLYDLRKHAPENSDTYKELSEQIAEAETNLKNANQLIEFCAKMKENGAIDTFFEKAQNGELPADEMNKFIGSLVEGNYAELIKHIPGLNIPENASEEEKKAKMKEALKATSKGLVWVLLAILAASATVAINATTYAAKQN